MHVLNVVVDRVAEAIGRKKAAPEEHFFRALYPSRRTSRRSFDASQKKSGKRLFLFVFFFSI
jgi:hypothetical protein